MDHNIAAWMMAGGPHAETATHHREREQLHAYLESRRAIELRRRLVDRVRALVRPAPPTAPVCCPA